MGPDEAESLYEKNQQEREHQSQPSNVSVHKVMMSNGNTVAIQSTHSQLKHTSMAQ